MDNAKDEIEEQDVVKKFLDDKIPGLFDIIDQYMDHDETSFQESMEKAREKYHHDENLRLKKREEAAALLTEYEEGEDDDAILSAETAVTVEVALDSGCVAHVAEAKNIPSDVSIDQPASGRPKNFVGAGGDTIKNHGAANIILEQEDGKQVTSTFQVADVCRALHSVSTICDNDHEVLFIKGGATVVPQGSLSRYLKDVKHLAAYPRRSGLYVSKMTARNPKRVGPNNDSKDAGKPTDKGFCRQGGR